MQKVCILFTKSEPYYVSLSTCVGGKGDCSYDLQIPDSKKQYNSSVGIPVRTIITCLGTPVRARQRAAKLKKRLSLSAVQLEFSAA